MTTLEQFACVRKANPAWQRGKLNFPGGKVLESEALEHAAHREFLEETGIDLPPHTWHEIATMHGADWRVHVMRCEHPFHDAPAGTPDEPAGIFTLDFMMQQRERFIHNVPWLAALSLDFETVGVAEVTAVYRGI
jgi:8-oxo-dGTP pyrophosphatase MutT (NUDIX family)